MSEEAEWAGQSDRACNLQCCTLKNAAETADAVKQDRRGARRRMRCSRREDVALKVFSMFFIFILAQGVGQTYQVDSELRARKG